MLVRPLIIRRTFDDADARKSYAAYQIKVTPHLSPPPRTNAGGGSFVCGIGSIGKTGNRERSKRIALKEYKVNQSAGLTFTLILSHASRGRRFLLR